VPVAARCIRSVATRLTFAIESDSLRASKGSLDWLREILVGGLFICPKTRPSSDDT